MGHLLSLLLATAAVAAGQVVAAKPASTANVTQPAVAARPVLVLVLNSKYAQVFENFVRAPGAVHMAQFDVHVVCTDHRIAGELANLGWRCSTMAISRGGGAAGVYTKRIPYVVSLIRKGRDVLICDIDAIWIKDPLPELLATQAGIISSPGGSPPLASAKLGVAFCMGFIFLRGSDPQVRDAIVPLTTPMNEDQTDFNKNMIREGLAYDNVKVPYPHTTVTYYGKLNAKEEPYDGLRIAMLPHSRFQRLCAPNTDFSYNATGGVTIAHCHNRGKQGYLKVKKLASIKLWFVPATADLSGLGSYPPMPEPRTPKWTVWQERRQQQAPASSSTAAPGTVPGLHPLQPPLQPGAALLNVTGDRYTSGGHMATGAATTGAQAAVSTASQSKSIAREKANAREKRAASEQSPRGVAVQLPRRTLSD